MGSNLTHRLWANQTDVEPIGNVKQRGTTAAGKVINVLVPELANDITLNASPDPTDYKPLIERPEACKNEATNNEPNSSSTAIHGTFESQDQKRGSDSGQYYSLQNLESVVKKKHNTRLPAETVVEYSRRASSSRSSDLFESIQSPTQKSNSTLDQQTRTVVRESLNTGTQPATTGGNDTSDTSGNNSPIHTTVHSTKPLKQSSRYIFCDSRSTKTILVDQYCWNESCSSHRLCRRYRLHTCFLVSLLLVSATSGALFPIAAYQCMLAAARHELERGSARMLEMHTELDEIRVEMMRRRRRSSECVSNVSTNTPDYTTIDRLIDDPPNDTAIRSLYYELAWAIMLDIELRARERSVHYCSQFLFTFASDFDAACSQFSGDQCCARDPSYWWRLAAAQYMLAHIQGEKSHDVFMHYMRQANNSAYFAISIGGNDSETYSW